MSTAKPAATASRVARGAAAVLGLVSSAESAALSDDAVPAVGGAVMVESSASPDCVGADMGLAAAPSPPPVAAARASKPAVMVTKRKKSAVVMSVMVSVAVPGSLASDPSAINVHIAVCCSSSQRWLRVLMWGVVIFVSISWRLRRATCPF